MKNKAIAALVCLNAALLAALMVGVAVPTADAQVIGGGHDYILMTGHIGKDWDAVYVLNLGTRQLAALRWDKTAQRLTPTRLRDLWRDFERKGF